MPSIRKQRRTVAWRSPVNLASYVAIVVMLGGAAWYAYLEFAPKPQLGDPAMATRGEMVFAQSCAACHGPGAVGQDSASPRGGMLPNGAFLAPALNGTGHAWHHPPDALFTIIQKGSPAEGSPMIGWEGRLSDEDIRATIAYVQSLWPDAIKSRYKDSFSMH